MIYCVNWEKVIRLEFIGEIEVPDRVDKTDERAVRNYIRDQIEEDDCAREVIKNHIVIERV